MERKLGVYCKFQKAFFVLNEAGAREYWRSPMQLTEPDHMNAVHILIDDFYYRSSL